MNEKDPVELAARTALEGVDRTGRRTTDVLTEAVPRMVAAAVRAHHEHYDTATEPGDNIDFARQAMVMAETATALSKRITRALSLCDQGTQFGSVDFRDIRRALTGGTAAARPVEPPSEPPARCTAHGLQACQQCHLTRPGGLTDEGECTGCETYGATGMHWDTCPNRAFEVYFGNDSARFRPELDRLRDAVRQVAYDLERLPGRYTLAHGLEPEAAHNCNALRVVSLLYADVTRAAEELRAAVTAQSADRTAPESTGDAS